MSFFLCNYSFVSLIARGLGYNIKSKSIFLFCKNSKANCVLLLKTHSNDSNYRFWANQWGDRCILRHGINKSAAVALLFNNFVGTIKNIDANTNGHWITCFRNQK